MYNVETKIKPRFSQPREVSHEIFFKIVSLELETEGVQLCYFCYQEQGFLAEIFILISRREQRKKIEENSFFVHYQIIFLSLRKNFSSLVDNETRF